MANGIIWIYSAKSGYIPCSDSNEVEAFRKSGFEILTGKPSAHKLGSAIIKLCRDGVTNQAIIEEATEESKELSREELIELASDGGVFIDKRWNAQRIKEALGL